MPSQGHKPLSLLSQRLGAPKLITAKTQTSRQHPSSLNSNETLTELETQRIQIPGYRRVLKLKHHIYVGFGT